VTDLARPNRLIGSFVFLSSIGTEKIELTRGLEECLLDDEDAIILQLYMSESRMCRATHAASHVISSQPG
jgi:ATP-dependent Clp protease ATP-binding subunit ClpA